jgi:hypothetical protein
LGRRQQGESENQRQAWPGVRLGLAGEPLCAGCLLFAVRRPSTAQFHRSV